MNSWRPFYEILFIPRDTLRASHRRAVYPCGPSLFARYTTPVPLHVFYGFALVGDYTLVRLVRIRLPMPRIDSHVTFEGWVAKMEPFMEPRDAHQARHDEDPWKLYGLVGALTSATNEFAGVSHNLVNLRSGLGEPIGLLWQLIELYCRSLNRVVNVSTATRSAGGHSLDSP